MDTDSYLNILEQRPGFTRYCINLAFIFEYPDDNVDRQVLEVLRQGLDRLSDTFPWVAGKIVREQGDGHGAGLYKIAPMERRPQLIVKDLRNDTSIWSMEQMKSAEFAPDLVLEGKFAPRGTGLLNVPASLPVLIVQTSFIQGGFVICISASHAATDLIGLYQIALAFHWACKGEKFRDEDIAVGNTSRRNIIPLLEPGEEVSKEVDHQRPTQSSPRQSIKSMLMAKCSWQTCKITKAAVESLKAEAGASLTSGYVSSDDVVSAVIWQAVTRARLQRLDSPKQTTIARSINARRYLGVNEAYPGLCINTAYSQFDMGDLVKTPIGTVAQALRSQIDPATSNFAHYTRSVATVLTNSPDKSILKVVAKLDFSSDLILTSGASISESMPLDFNLGLGNPVAVRIPLPSPLGMQSMAAIAPKNASGDWTIYLCLRDDDMNHLKQDPLFTRHASWIRNSPRAEKRRRLVLPTCLSRAMRGLEYLAGAYRTLRMVRSAKSKASGCKCTDCKEKRHSRSLTLATAVRK